MVGGEPLDGVGFLGVEEDLDRAGEEEAEEAGGIGPAGGIRDDGDGLEGADVEHGPEGLGEDGGEGEAGETVVEPVAEADAVAGPGCGEHGGRESILAFPASDPPMGNRSDKVARGILADLYHGGIIHGIGRGCKGGWGRGEGGASIALAQLHCALAGFDAARRKGKRGVTALLMNIFKKIFGRDGKFYDLLEASALDAKNSASILGRTLALQGTPEFEAALADLAQARRRHKKTSREITTQLCRTFVTPLEREDIESLSSALYRISKNVEKIGEHLLIAPHQVVQGHFATQAKMMEGAADAVITMVKGLRNKGDMEGISDTYEKLQTIEGDADKLMVNLLRDLYRQEGDVRSVIALKDLYELFEKVIDRCRDAGNIVFEVVLKYS